MNVTLAVPQKGIRYKSWARFVGDFLLGNANVLRFVFHSRHVKVWFKRYQRIPRSKSITIKDRTEHFDERLLTMAYKISGFAKEKKYDNRKAASILLHYLFNMSQLTYQDEASYHLERHKAISKFLKKKYTAKQDHGWELDELIKAGLIKK